MSKTLRLAKSSTPKTQIGLKLSLHDYTLFKKKKKQFSRVPKLAVVRSQAPVIGPHTYTKMKVEYLQVLDLRLP